MTGTQLARFLDAQFEHIDKAVDELRAGRKEGHWIWFVFPHLDGIGHSEVSRKFALRSRQEVQDFYEHPLLGPQLRECTQIMNELSQRPIQAVLPPPDDDKFHACMTLFGEVSDDGAFKGALAKYFNGHRHNRTMELLREL